MLTSENTMVNTLAHAAEDGFDVVVFEQILLESADHVAQEQTAQGVRLLEDAV